VTQLEQVLRQSCFPPQCLTLELTESVLLTSGALLEQRLSMLKEIGVTLALDDFGTGYASLSYLQRFPVDVVKIDQSFIAEIDGASTDFVLLKGIIDLSRGLGLNTVVEGVETREQHQVVQSLGCDGAQGFYFGYPAQVAQRDLLDDGTSPLSRKAPRNQLPEVGFGTLSIVATRCPSRSTRSASLPAPCRAATRRSCAAG
jgi:EAL domain-containing protein (putative c-di-GMP-specific phosphodiesterase class I)